MKRTDKHQATRAWRGWYSSALWQTRRAAQLQAEPLCQWCAKLGKVTAATDVHHVTAHRGNWALFSAGQLESLCHSCHSAEGQREDAGLLRRGGGVDGVPLDPRHPWNAPARASGAAPGAPGDRPEGLAMGRPDPA